MKLIIVFVMLALAGSSFSISITSCPVISQGGSYSLAANIIGAPNNASPVTYYEYSCVKIAASNVIFDCNGYNITNNGVSGTTYGILLNGSISNVTVQNCPSVSGYTFGIYVYQSDHNNITNSTAINDTTSGIYLYSSHYDTLINSIGSSNVNPGIYVYSSSNNNFINSVGTTTTPGYGILLQLDSNNNNFINTTGISSGDGIYVISYSDNNTFINSTGIGNSSPGIRFDTYSNNNVLINSTGISNSSFGIGITGNSSNNTITNSTGISNYSDGIALEANSNTIISSAGISNASSGIFLYIGSNNSNVINSSGISNSNIGIYLSSSPNSNVINSTATSNSNFGIIIYLSPNSNVINSTGASQSGYGILLQSTPNTNLINSTGTSISGPGIYLLSTSSDTIASSAGTSNSSYGIWLASGSNNTLASSIGTSNSSYAILINSSDNNTIINSTGSSYSNVGLYIYSSNYTTITNSTGTCAWGDGIYLYSSNYTTILNSTGISDKNYGIRLYLSSNNLILNSTGISNHGLGIYLASSSSNTFVNAIGTSNLAQGIYLASSSNNTFINSTGTSNSSYGIYIFSSSNNAISNSTLSGSSYGLYIVSSNATLLSNDHYYNNSIDFFVGGPSSFNMSNAIFDNPLGNFQHFSNLTINDSLSSGESYAVSWSANPTALHPGYSSFVQKFVNISVLSGNPSIDSIVWTWTPGELGSYNESEFSLLGYNGSWNLLNGSPDTTAHTLSMTSLKPGAIYGIMEPSSLPPAVTLNSPANLSISNSSAVTFSFTAVSNQSITMNCSLFLDNVLSQSNSSTLNNTATLFLISSIPDGNHFWYVQCTDNANNTGTSLVNNLTIDTQAPLVTLNSPANLSISNSSIVTFSFTAVDNFSTIMNCSIFLDGTLNQSNPSTLNNTATTFSISTIPDGNNAWYVLCMNAVNNTGTSVTRTFTVETSAPSLTIQNPVNNSFSSSANIPLDYSVSDPNLQSCWYTTDGGVTNTTLPDCSNTSFTASEGSNTVTVYANNSAGNQNSSSATFTVETSAPSLTIQNPVNNSFSSSANIPLDYSVSDPNLQSCWYTINGGDSVPLPDCSNTSFTASEGSNTVTVYANNSAGNQNSSSATFTVETSAPSLTIQNPVNNSFSSSANIPLDYSVSDSNLQSCWYTTDGGVTNTTLPDCSNTSFTASEGSNTVTVYANNSAGNQNSSSATFTVETSAPSLTIQNPVNNSFSSSANIPLDYSVSDPNLQSCWYTTDGGVTNTTLPDCSNTSFTASEGSNTVTVYANNSAGNQNSSSATFTVETSAPSLTIQNPVNNSFSSSANIPLDYSVSDSNLQSCWYTINGGDSVPLPDCSNTSFTASVGSNTVTVYANDSAGNVNSSTAAFTVETIPPSVSLNSPANLSLSNVSSVTFNFTAVDNFSTIMSCSIYLDGILNQTNASTLNNTATLFIISGIPDGNHSWYVQCRDNANNTGTSATSSFAIDTTAPLITINSPANNTIYNSSSVLVNISVVEAHPASTWFFNGSANQTYTVPVNKTYADGSYNMTVWSNDTLGHLSSAVASFSVDTISPRISFVAPTFNSSSLLKFNYIEINVTASDAHLSNITIRLYNSSRALINSTTTTSANKFSNFTNLPDGTYYFNATAYDAANHSNSTATWNVTLDTTAPIITIISPMNNTLYNTSTIRINISVIEPHPSRTWFFNGTANQTYTGSINKAYSDGSYNLTVWSNDTLGHLSTASVNFSVDTIRPRISFVAPTFNASTFHGLSYIEVNVTASDAHLSNITIRLYNSSRALINSTKTTNPNLFANFTSLPYGTYYFNATAYDAVGHSNSTATRRVILHS